MKLAAVLTASLAGLALAANLAQAQTPADGAPAAGGTPAAGAASSTPPQIKNVGDWAVRCFPVQNSHPCDIFQEQGDTKTGQRLLSVSVAYVPQADRNLIQISVPLEVFIPRGVVIQTDGYTSPMMKYRMCTRDGCFVQAAVDNAMMDALGKASSGSAKVDIVGDNGRGYALTFSLKGFAAAHDEAMNEARTKASKTPAAPAKPAAP